MGKLFLVLSLAFAILFIGCANKPKNLFLLIYSKSWQIDTSRAEQ